MWRKKGKNMEKLYLEVCTRAGERFDDKLEINVYEYPLKNHKITKAAREDIVEKLGRMTFSIRSDYFSSDNIIDQFDMNVGRYRKMVGHRFTLTERTIDEVTEDFFKAIHEAIEHQIFKIESINRSLYCEYETKSLLDEMLMAEPFRKLEYSRKAGTN